MLSFVMYRHAVFQVEISKKKKKKDEFCPTRESFTTTDFEVSPCITLGVFTNYYSSFASSILPPSCEPLPPIQNIQGTMVSDVTSYLAACREKITK